MSFPTKRLSCRWAVFSMSRSLQKFSIKSPSQFATTAGLPSIIFSSFALGAAFGGYIPLLSLWLEVLGRSFNDIGITNGVIGLGIIISAYFVPRLAHKIGVTKLIILGLMMASVMALLFRLTEQMYLWIIIRFLSGLGLGVHWVLSEAWLIKIAKPQFRARAIALYATAMSLGFAVGPAIIWVFGYRSIEPFAVIAMVLIIGALPFFWIRKYEPDLTLNVSKSPIRLIAKFPTIMAACIVAGGIDLAMLSLLPAMVVRTPGADTGLIMTLVPAMALGTIFFQYPIAKLADRHNPAALSAFIAAIGIMFASTLPFFMGSLIVANLMAFVGAGLIYGLYTLGLTMLSQRVSAGDLVAANAGFVIVFEISNLVGPTAAGWMVDVNLTYGFSVFVVLLGVLYLAIFWLRHGRTQ